MNLEQALETLRKTGYIAALDRVEDELNYVRQQRDLAQQALQVNESHVPVAARDYDPATFHITEFARNCSVDLNQAGEFKFGLDHRLTAAALRELADAFTAGQLLPQEVTATENSRYDDFVLVTLTLVLADRRKAVTS